MRDKRIDQYALECILMNIGSYCRGVHKDGEFHPRTEWQEGWNAAISEVMDRQIAIYKFFEDLTISQKDDLIYLLECDGLSISQYDDKIYLYSNMNDTFYYACADEEEYTVDDLEMLVDVHRNFSYDGITASAALRRKSDPIPEHNTQKYQEAKNYIISNWS